MSNGEGRRRVSVQDIQRVQNLIEGCLLLYMTEEEVKDTLFTRAQVERRFTELVWQKLETENPEFFKAYHLSLMAKNQILRFNQLLHRQSELMHQLYPTGAAPVPSPNASQIHPLLKNSAHHTPESGPSMEMENIPQHTNGASPLQPTTPNAYTNGESSFQLTIPDAYNNGESSFQLFVPNTYTNGETSSQPSVHNAYINGESSFRPTVANAFANGESSFQPTFANYTNGESLFQPTISNTYGNDESSRRQITPNAYSNGESSLQWAIPIAHANGATSMPGAVNVGRASASANMTLAQSSNPGMMRSDVNHADPRFMFGADTNLQDPNGTVSPFIRGESGSQAANRTFMDHDMNSFGFLGQLPQNFSLSDLAADFSNSTDILDYSRSPFVGINGNFQNTRTTDEQGMNRMGTISEDFNYEDFGSA